MDMTVRQDTDFSVGDLSSDAQIAFYKYWLEIKEATNMPRRCDFDPMKIPVALPKIIMNDVCYNPLRFKLRLIGSKCNLPNKYLGSYIDEVPDIMRMQKMLEICTEQKKPYFSMNELLYDGNYTRVYSSLILPFSNDNENVNILMTCYC